MQFNISNPTIYEMRDDSPASYSDMIEQVSRQMNPMMMMVVVSNNRADRYAVIKKKCCVDRPVPTQVIASRILKNQKGLMSVATKVAIQMNCKMGGIPWSIKIPLTGLMVVGFDTYKDSSKRGRSFGKFWLLFDSIYESPMNSYS